ncbi:MAG: EAL domain-containing protein [Desulfuromonas sp.]|nr:EAL domain-containing protein [Desulfuromonas sp.]
MQHRSHDAFDIFSFFRSAGGIACTYAAISFLWIYLSDNLLLVLGFDLQEHYRFQIYKGSFFVCLTAALLFFLLRNAINRAQHGNELFRKVVETIPMGILLADLDGGIIDGNSAAKQLLQDCAIDDFNNLRGWHVGTGSQLRTQEWSLSQALQDEESAAAKKIEIDGADGKHKTILYSSFPLTSEKIGKTGTMVLVQDITEKVIANNELRRFKFSIEQASEAIFWLNQEGRFLFVNDQACRSLGYSAEELQTLYLWDIDPTFTRARWKKQWLLLEKVGTRFFETQHQHRDGSLFPVEVFSHHQHVGNNQTLHVAFIRDISLRKKYQHQLEHQLNHDALTGLANRVLLDDRVQQSILYAKRSAKQVAVFLLDLDRFKVINDSLGHKQGDNVLVKVSQRLSTCLLPGDTLARLGGDEFAIVLSDATETADVLITAQKILNVFDKPFKLGARELRITASMGASLYPRDGQSCEDLMRQADAAMYQAKNQGGDGFQLCSTEMDARAHRALELEADLRQALVGDEFVLHYQPKVKIDTNSIDGCEALVRWQHPEKGLISPGEFIPLAEENGLIIPLGSWVLRAACRQFKAWQDMGLPPIKIAVNLSARQFMQPDFIKKIQLILTEEEIDPRWIDLELTESMVMQDPDKVVQTLIQLKELGFSLSLDNFGTGYSSLNYLRRFPIDCLKIDRSFIIDVDSDTTAASVVNSVIGIAHSLGISAIAEGVETLEQYRIIADYHCDAIQGFLFSKPLDPETFAKVVLKDTTFGMIPLKKVN